MVSILKVAMPQLYSFRLAFFIFFVSLITGICSSQVLAQSTTNKTPADSAKVDVIEPVPLAGIGTATEKTLSIREIREIKSKLIPSQTELELDSLIPLKLAAVEKLQSETDLEEVAEMNLKQA